MDHPGGKGIMDIFRTKSVDELREASSRESHFRRELHGWQLILLGIGCIIGTGIFVLTGTAAARHAGPAIAISFVVSALGCLCAALCYAEFSSMLPVTGSAYTYAYATLGEFIAWIIGWDLILEYAIGAVTVSIGWSGYVVSFARDLGIDIPAAARRATARSWTDLRTQPHDAVPAFNGRVNLNVAPRDVLAVVHSRPP